MCFALELDFQGYLPVGGYSPEILLLLSIQPYFKSPNVLGRSSACSSLHFSASVFSFILRLSYDSSG